MLMLIWSWKRTECSQEVLYCIYLRKNIYMGKWNHMVWKPHPYLVTHTIHVWNIRIYIHTVAATECRNPDKAWYSSSNMQTECFCPDMHRIHVSFHTLVHSDNTDFSLIWGCSCENLRKKKYARFILILSHFHYCLTSLPHPHVQGDQD